MLPPSSRIQNLDPFIEQELYVVIHAARQTGKTTAMRAFAQTLRERGIASVWATLETSQGVTETIKAEPQWISNLESAASLLPLSQQPDPLNPSWPEGERLRLFLHAWAAKLSVPLVLLLDEADTISGPALVSFLRQLRAGFMDRGIGKFPTSIALIGMRDLRDYLTQSKDGVAINPGSSFNIKVASLTLRNFNAEEVAELYAQHTTDTGQTFHKEAVERAYYWTEGQPFLVNALARICVMELATHGEEITESLIDTAKERLILSRTTHLDALRERLKEPRVARVIQAVLLGDMEVPYDHDDYQYCVDLGLLSTRQSAEVSCPLYREVLARELTLRQQLNLPRPWWVWQKPDGGLDMPALMEAFLEWWRENAEIVEERATAGYLEAVAHLAFMAFLQRVINGGGRVIREFAAGRDALDLLVEFGGERHVIELKRVPPTRVALETVKRKGTAQLCRYLDTLGESSGWLLIFDQRKGLSWEQRLWAEDVVVNGRTLWLRGA